MNRRSNAQWGHGVSLDRFVEANILRLGLVMACPSCQKKNWFGIENLRLQLTCERCLKTFAFPQGSLNFQQTPWQYRVIGPYSVPNYAEGSYSTVLALSVFAGRLGSDNPKLTYATGLELKFGDDSPFEVDFTFWYQRARMFGRDEEPALVFGEAKSFAAESFKPEDIARMRKLAEQFPGASIAFATLKEELSAAEKAEIAAFALWGRERLHDGSPRTPVIVLTAAELFCSWHVVRLCLRGPGYSASQELAAIWISEGIDSVVFPSATRAGRNVAVYLANATAGSVVVRNRAEVLAALRRPRAGKRGR